MKTKLIIVGIIVVIAISITYVSLAYNQEIKLATGMMTSDEKPQPAMLSDPICFVVDRGRSGETGSAVTMDRCVTLSEFEEMGCTKPMLEHLNRHSNLLDYELEGLWYLEWASLPEGMSKEDFDNCIDAILEKRPILNPDSVPEPETKSIITINERIPERTIVPITVTQMTKHVEPFDTVTYWGFTILGIEMETLGDYWGNLPPKYDTHIITEQNGNEAVDYNRVPGGFLTYKLTLWTYPATCDDGTKIRGEGGYPEPIPIKQGVSTVFFNHTGVGLYPDDDGNYSLDFVSGFETDIEFPPDATILSQDTKQCSLDKQKGNFTDVYYTNAQFRFD